MEKKKEGKPGEARAILRRSVRENGCVHSFQSVLYFMLFSQNAFFPSNLFYDVLILIIV